MTGASFQARQLRFPPELPSGGLHDDPMDFAVGCPGRRLAWLARRWPRPTRRSATTGRSGRSWPTIALPVTAPIVRPARPTCGSTSATQRSKPARSCPASRRKARWSSGSPSADESMVMPPAETHKTAHGRAKRPARPLDRRRCRVRAPLVADPAGAAGAARGAEQIVVSQPDRRLHPGPARSRGADAGAGGRPPHAGPSREPRPDGVAARAGRRRGLCQRHQRRTPMKSWSTGCSVRRPGASTAAATGSTRPAMPTRMASTSTTSARCGRIATGSSRPSTATCRSIEFTIEQLAGDLLPDRTLDQLVASGFNRCNMTTNEGGVIPEEYVVLYARDRTDTACQVWMGTDGRLRRVSRPQVRSAHADGVLRVVGVLQQHHAERDGRQHQGHAARGDGARA